MRGDRAVRDSRHNKDLENLKSSLKKGNKSKKHRVVFDESANEFFEADYIIVVRDECGYSDGENEDCSGCEACDRFQEPETGALSPPEGYKDLGLFNRDGTLREQAWWEAGDVVLVGERSGTVFTPQHLQLLRRLQRERMLRSAVCADCDAHAVLQQPHEVEYGYEEEDGSDDVERELRPVVRRTGKHIAAGEERPRINSSQQTTPTDESPTGLLMDRNNSSSVPQTSEEESDSGDVEGRMSLDSSPLRHRRAGILKGGRLWKLTDSDKDNEQNDDQRSTTTASDEDGSVTPRSVRFLEKPKDSVENVAQTDITGTSDTENSGSKDYTSNSNHRMETPLILTVQPSKTNSAVQQLFSSSRPPPPAIEPQLVTSETLRAWDAGVRPKTEETAFRRVAERNALRCSLLRSEAKKKQQPKTQETTSLAERIRLLTCDVDDDPDEQRSSSMSGDKSYTGSDKSSDKSYNSVDKCSEKTFASASSSSSSSTLSAPMANRQQPDLGDFHQEPLKTRTEPRRQFLSTLAPLTACVGTAAHHDGFYFVSPSDRSSASTTNLDHKEHNDSPAPDVVAGTPGANDGDDGLAAFARAVAPRTERIRQRYGQDSQPVSSDDEHDDYGFQRRPAVRGIAVKQQLGASDQMLQEMQNELKSTSIVSATTTVAATATPPHACQRTTNTYSWPYYSEAHLNSRPQSRASANSNWSTSSEYVSGRQCARTPVHSDTCYTHAHTHAAAAQTYYHQQQHDPYRNCALYANVGCSDSSQEVFSSQTSSEQTSPEQGHRNRRAESPPPIRSHHQLLYVPYNTHYHYQPDYGQWTSASDYTHSMHSYYQQQQQSCGVSTPQPTTVTHSQRSQYTHALQLQTLCPVPMRYRPVPGPQSSGGKTMICYSEKVAPPMYQAAPGSPSRSARSAPEGVPAPISVASATSPMTPSPNPVYYAMNV